MSALTLETPASAEPGEDGSSRGSLPRSWLAGLPNGSHLSGPVWERRHRFVQLTLLLHIAVFAVLFAAVPSLITGNALQHALELFALALLFAGGAWRRLGRTTRALSAAMGLLSCSALIVHLSNGHIEAHFHYFVAVALIASYEQWRVYALACGFVLMQHALLDTTNFGGPPTGNHWVRAFVHTSAVLVLSVLLINHWRANQALQSQRSRALSFAQVIQSAALDLIVLTEPESRRWVWVSNSTRRLGWPIEDLLQMESMDLVHPEDQHTALAARQHILNTGETTTGNVRLRTRDGGFIWFEVLSAPVTIGDSRYIILTMRDITVRRAAEEQLRTSEAAAREAAKAALVAQQNAERALAVRTEFLSRMSHELRTPLNTIVLTSQLMAESTEDPQTRQDTELILSSSSHLLELINDALDLRALDADVLALSVEPVDVDAVLREACELIAPHVTATSLSLQHTPGGQSVLADASRLRQVALNLLANAVKYNVEGGTICVHTDTTTLNDAPAVAISVTDSGIGIDPSDQARIFQPFSRVRPDRSEIEGTGLGLAVSHELIVAMNGALSVDSRPGQGSTFTITLPAADSQ